jgi:hypothetical protein
LANPRGQLRGVNTQNSAHKLARLINTRGDDFLIANRNTNGEHYFLANKSILFPFGQQFAYQ